MTGQAVHIELLKERNKLLRESVELQREHFDWSKQQALEQQKRLGDYADKLWKDGLKDILSELRSADSQSIPEDDAIIMGHVREAIKKLEILLG
jgi:hypothetical protein